MDPGSSPQPASRLQARPPQGHRKGRLPIRPPAKNRHRQQDGPGKKPIVVGQPEVRRAAGGQAAGRLAARRNRNRTIGIASVVLVVVIVVAFIVVKVAAVELGRLRRRLRLPAGRRSPAGITNKLASVPLEHPGRRADQRRCASPPAISDPKLTADGKPELLYIGAEFCPICATERWAMYVALSKFGTFSPQPGRIHSAVRDGDIPTLTFYRTTYTSPYLTFTPVETTTNQPDGNYYVTLQTPTAAQDEAVGRPTSTPPTFPWLDFGARRS